jgi:RES domain-containing protein
VRVWQLSPKKRASTAFSGEGTRLVGSRWTHQGLAGVYTSESIALAILESLAHMEVSHPPPHVIIPADLPGDMVIEEVDPGQLSSDWYVTPALPLLRDIGTDWLRSQRTAVLKVPSAIVNDESNYLLNPLHPEFARISIGEARNFTFDGRLWRSGV